MRVKKPFTPLSATHRDPMLWFPQTWSVTCRTAQFAHIARVLWPVPPSTSWPLLPPTPGLPLHFYSLYLASGTPQWSLGANHGSVACSRLTSSCGRFEDSAAIHRLFRSGTDWTSISPLIALSRTCNANPSTNLCGCQFPWPAPDDVDLPCQGDCV